jgi:hypothetical protein
LRSDIADDLLTSDGQTVPQSTVGEVDRCSVVSPDSPMIYSGRALRKTRERPVREVLSQGTRQCPVRPWMHYNTPSVTVTKT